MRTPAPFLVLALCCACSTQPVEQAPTPPRPPAQPTQQLGGDLRPQPPQGGHLPSSFTEPSDRMRVEQTRAAVTKAVEKGTPLHSLFGYRSRSPVVADAMELEAADVVADIGAGTGAFELFLLEGEYAFEKVWAVDIDAPALELMDWILEASGMEGVDRVQALHSRDDDVMLPPASVTKVLLLNTPFYLSRTGELRDEYAPRRCQHSLVDALQPGGLLVVAERHVTSDEDSVSLEDDPAVRCAPITTPWTELGLELRDQRMVKLDEPDRGAHCLVRLVKPPGLELILGERDLSAAPDPPPPPDEGAPRPEPSDEPPGPPLKSR